jgi:hypothetical protein
MPSQASAAAAVLLILATRSLTVSPNIRPLLLMLAVAAAVPLIVQAKPVATGHFQAGEKQFTVADALAWRDGEDLKVVFSDAPFDRANFAEDGKLDSFDFMRHAGTSLSFGVSDEGEARFVSVQSDGGSSFMTGIGETLVLSRRDDANIAGTFTVGDSTAITFDLPISASTLERPGEPLPADGGEPGRVLLARMKAIHDGDMETLMANTPPDQAEEMRQSVASGEAEQLLAMAKLFTPTDIAVTGGRQDGDTAWVDFTGLESGSKVTGTGKLLRVDGSWRVESVNTSQSSD